MPLVAATSPLLFLALLACPVGMGLMMVFMGRGMRMGGGSKKQETEHDESALATMKAEQARLAARIEELEGKPASEDPQQSRDGARSEKRAGQVS